MTESYETHPWSWNRTSQENTTWDIKYWQKTGEILNSAIPKEDLELVNMQWCENLWSKNIQLDWFKWITIAFQHTKNWWEIVSHNHDDTDELIILMDWSYWDIWGHKTENWIMRIPKWKQHWWKSVWTWISIKPVWYNFVESNEYWLIYEKWSEKILIYVWEVWDELKSFYVGDVWQIIMGNNRVEIGATDSKNISNKKCILIWKIDLNEINT